MIYSIPYVLFILFYGVLAWIYRTAENKNKQLIIIITIVAYLFFLGFRGFVWDDWTAYYPIWDSMEWGKMDFSLISIDDYSFEPGFTLLMFICKQIIPEYVFFQLVCCIIDLILLYCFFKDRIQNFPLALILFLCMGGYIMQINQLRNSITILLFANSIKLIYERKAIAYFAVCIIGTLFHSSMILYIPLYFFIHKRFPRWFLLLVFFIGNAVFLLHIHYLSPILLTIASFAGERYATLIDAYINSAEFATISTGLSIGFLERILTSVLIYCYYDKLINMRQENVIFINLFVLFFIMYFYFSEFYVAATRLANLFTIAYWILWYDLIHCFSIENNRRLFISFLSIYCIFKVIGLTHRPTLDYENVLLGAKSFEERKVLHDKEFEELEQ